jgi:hypothetical protein
MTNEARQHIQDIDKQDEQDLEEKASNLKVDPNYFRKATGNQGQVKVAYGDICSQHQKKWLAASCWDCAFLTQAVRHRPHATCMYNYSIIIAEL